MKIDVEGHEYEILLGAKETITAKCPQIFVEPHHIKDGITNHDQIKSFLAKFGYKFKEFGYPIWCYHANN